MKELKAPIAIVGAGPSGSSLAYLLSRSDREVMLFAAPVSSKKYCGGGIPARSFDDLPWFEQIPSPFKAISRITLISPSGISCDLNISRPLRVFEREAFDKRLRELARSHGAGIIPERVRSLRREGASWLVRTDLSEYRAGFLVGAGGAASLVRRRLSRRSPPSALSLCAGYYFTPPDEHTIFTGFLKRRAAYAWIFPRPGQASAGIVAPLYGSDKKSLLRELRDWLERSFPSKHFDYSRSYAALVPAFTGGKTTVAGYRWALVGDAAAVADPVSREGIYFSIKSSELLATALLNWQPENYPYLLRRFQKKHFEPAAFLRNYLFAPFFTERLIRLAKRNIFARRALERFFSGSLDYGSSLLKIPSIRISK